MKTKIIAFVTAFTMIASISSATGIKPAPEAIVAAFKQEFKKANNISWIKTNDYYKAVFSINEHLIQAYYSIDGELLAVSKKLTMLQLPMILADRVKEIIGTSPVSDLFELSTDRGTEYFLSFKRENKTRVYKTIDENWVRY